MYRRRRPQREKISFSFDSFLDVVANVIGIIIRLILVTWVGARSYTATLNMIQDGPGDELTVPGLPAPRVEDDPLNKDVLQARREIEKVRAKLLEQLRQLELVENKEKTVRDQLVKVGASKQELDRDKQALLATLGKNDLKARYAVLSLEEVRAKGKKLQDEIGELAKVPTPTKTLRYHTPVSRPVGADEVFFECRMGRVTFIDLAAFRHEMEAGVKDKVEALKSQWEVTSRTSAVGPFRMQYIIERVRDFADNLAGGGPPPRTGGFSYGLAGWILEPISEDRGETLEVALSAKSNFRQVIDGLDQRSVVTLWVYPDSFETFRRLRDFLYERDLEIAARPLPFGASIAASRHGTASRGQ